MRKSLFILVAVVLVMGSLIPAAVSAQEPKWDIGMLAGPQDNPYWIAAVDGAKMAAEDFDINLTILAPTSESDVTLQIGQMEDRVTKGDDAIVIAPIDTKALIKEILRLCATFLAFYEKIVAPRLCHKLEHFFCHIITPSDNTY